MAKPLFEELDRCDTASSSSTGVGWNYQWLRMILLALALPALCGYEDLSEKCKIIKDLPNLHLFHISPSTSEEAVYEHMHECNVAFELHSHPTGVLENYTKEEMKSILQKRHDVFKDKPYTLMLADIKVIAGRLDRLKMWVDVAQELANS
jgi:hypothetical protein